MTAEEVSRAHWVLVDFGAAAWLNRPRATVQSPAHVSPSYSPPEVLLGLPSGPPHDIWQAGCCVFEMATGSKLFSLQGDPEGAFSDEEHHLWMMAGLLGRMPLKMVHKSTMADRFFDCRGFLHMEYQHALVPQPLGVLLVDTFQLVPEDADSLAEFLTPMLMYDPDQRATAKQLLDHPWLRES